MKAKVGNSRRAGKRRSAHQARLREDWRRRWERIKRGLDKQSREATYELLGERPVLQGANVRFAMAARHTGTAYGGVAVMHPLVRELGLA